MSPIRPLLMCGPSGSGKSTLLNKLFADYPDKFSFCTSHTTRSPRPGEVDGVHYHFTNKEWMLKAIEEGKFIESATFSGNIYGTSKASIETVLSHGKVCVLDIDTQGVKQVKKSGLEPHYVFVKPPSMEVLKKRLEDRKTETEESLKLRLSHAQSEIEYGEMPGNFDLIIINDDLETAYNKLKQFIEIKVCTN